jgi:hypothetical protein
MRFRNKHTGKVIDVGDKVVEVMNAFLVPEQCLLKADYERVDDEKEKEKT